MLLDSCLLVNLDNKECVMLLFQDFIYQILIKTVNESFLL